MVHVHRQRACPPGHRSSLGTSPAFAQGQQQPGEQIIRQEQPAGPGATLNVSPAVVRQIQQALNQRGYTAGHVDGTWGARSQEAMKQFQKAQGLEPTGNINQRTMAALGINPSAAVSQRTGTTTMGAGGAGTQAGQTGQNR